jgi:hypothetical protein
MGHSISGVYGLDYVNKYPNEVIAFAGLDSSVPPLSEKEFDPSVKTTLTLLKKAGLVRMVTKQEADLPFDDDTKEQMRYFMHKNIYNPDQLKEAVNMYPNFKKAERLTFPSSLPVIFFLQAKHPAADRWIPEHEKQIKDSVHGKIVLFDAGHYLHRTEAKEIVKDFREFMTEAK